MVAVYNIALFINGDAAIGIAVKGKTDVKMIFPYECLKRFDVRRAVPVVDVRAVGGGAYMAVLISASFFFTSSSAVTAGFEVTLILRHSWG